MSPTIWTPPVKNQANLVNDEADCISKQALIADGEPSPLVVVHFAFDCAHSRKAGSAEQVEGQEGIATDGGEGAGQVAVNRTRAAVKNAHRANDVLLSNKTGNRGHGSLPVAPAKRRKDPSDGAADGSQNAGIDLVFSQHSELAIHKTKVRGEPNHNGGKQDDSAGLFDEGPAPAPTYCGAHCPP